MNTIIPTDNAVTNLHLLLFPMSGKNVTLPNGFRVTITETLTGWYKVSFNLNGVSLSGYVSADFLTLKILALAAFFNVIFT